MARLHGGNANGNPQSRVYAYEVVVVGDDPKARLFKCVFAEGMNLGYGHEPNHGITMLEIPGDQLPAGKKLTIGVRPLSSLGTKGKTISTTNAGKTITGDGTISLAAGTTLALASTGYEFATPDIVPVTLPSEGAATIRIDGTRLRSGEHVLCTLASVPENLADHVTVTGMALDSRKYEVKTVEETEDETTVTKLVLNILPGGLMVIFR